MSHSLSKRIILSPTQLQRLLGRDRELSSRADMARMGALASATKAAPKIGSSQAYAQYRATQQRQLNQSAQERDASLELVVSDPAQPKGPAFVPDLINLDQEVDEWEPLKTPEGKRKKPKTPKVTRNQKSGFSRQRKRNLDTGEDHEAGPSTPKSRTSKPRRIIVHTVPAQFSPVRTRSKVKKSPLTSWLRYGERNAL